MKIQILTGAREKFPAVRLHDFDHLPHWFRELGHDVDIVARGEWKNFYLKYLKFKPDVLISVGLIAALPAFLKRIGLIRRTILVNDWTDYWTDMMATKYPLAWLAFFEHYGIQHADFVVTSTIANLERCKLFNKKCYYRVHGVDLDFSKGEPAKLAGKFNILYFVSQEKSKRLDRLITAVNEVSKKIDCHLYLIGKPNPDFQKIAGQNIHFLGFVSDEDSIAYFKACDVVAMTMDSDGSPKLFQYFKAGKPLLVLRGKISNIMTHGENAYIAQDLSAGILELYEKPELRKKLAAGISKMPTKSWKEVTQDYITILENELKIKQTI